MPRFSSRQRRIWGLLATLIACGGDASITSGTTTGPATTTEATATTASLEPTSSGSPATDTTLEATIAASTTDPSSTAMMDPSGSTAANVTTTATTVDGTTSTTTSAPDPMCGDGAIDPGETCDDGANNGPGQACNAMCAPNTCGDGDKGPDEACDDGNLADGDGCSALCTVEPVALGKIFMTSANGEPGFHGYTIASDTWMTLASPPDVTCTQLTNDGVFVYLIGLDNTIYQYDIDGDAWSPSAIPGPGEDLVVEPIGYFKWTDQGFYYLHDYEQTLRRYKDGMWHAIPLTSRGACAGSWVRSEHALYIRTWNEMGFQVIDTMTDTIVRTIADDTTITENSRFGSLSGGSFYTRTFTGTLQRLDAVTGVKTDTGLLPTAHHNASDTDVTTGRVYIGGYEDLPSVFQVYDPENNQLTTLAPSPPVANHSSITVMIPP